MRDKDVSGELNKRETVGMFIIYLSDISLYLCHRYLHFNFPVNLLISMVL